MKISQIRQDKISHLSKKYLKYQMNDQIFIDNNVLL